MEEIFKCKMCGHCCHGEATVSVSLEEQERIASFLGITIKRLRQEYLHPKKDCTEMKIVDGHCIFYGQDGLCRIHPVKPFHCKQWPLHPSILGDEAAWKAIKSDCPGFRQDVSYQEVKEYVREKLNGT